LKTKCSEKHFDEAEDETGKWVKVHNEEFHNSYSLPDARGYIT
jgi:hypothetical protein